MGWLDDLTSPDIFGGGDPEVGSSDWFTQGLSDLQPTDYTSGIFGGGGNDWLSPVGSETGDYFTDSDIFGGDWLGGGDGGDDWIGDWFSSLSDPEVGSADWTTQGLSDLDYEGSILDSILNPNYFTDDDIQNYFTSGDVFGTSFLDDLLGGDLPEATYDPVTGVGTGVAGGDPAGGDEELTWWQKLIGKGSGPFGGSILGSQEGTTQGLLGGLLSLLGIGGGGGGIFGGGAGAGEEGAGGGIGGLFGSNPLMAFLMMKSLMKDDKSPGDIIPVGQQAYGAPEAYNMPDYRVTNLQPALMPGVGYANMAQPQQPPPPDVGIPQQPTAMRQGGIASLSEPIPPRGDPDRRTPPAPTPRQMQMQAYQTGAAPRGGGRGWKEGGLTSLSEGPGDITLAKLEPGEFVMTRKATQNIGAKNLYDLMKRAEGRGG